MFLNTATSHLTVFGIVAFLASNAMIAVEKFLPLTEMG